MKLSQIRIRNFRCYGDEFEMPVDELTCIIAKNDAGKSTVLEALDAFFNLDKLDAEDRTIGAGNASPIEMTCIFRDLQARLIVDSDALIAPQNEYLLNADGLLEIKKVFSGTPPQVRRSSCQGITSVCGSLWRPLLVDDSAVAEESARPWCKPRRRQSGAEVVNPPCNMELSTA